MRKGNLINPDKPDIEKTLIAAERSLRDPVSHKETDHSSWDPSCLGYPQLAPRAPTNEELGIEDPPPPRRSFLGNFSGLFRRR